MKLAHLALLAALATACQSTPETRPAPATPSPRPVAKAVVPAPPPTTTTTATPSSTSTPVADAGPPPPIDCPAGEVPIPATPAEGFTMGRGAADSEVAAHTVVLTHAFCMDADEVSAGDYDKCVNEHACPIPGTEDTYATFRRHPEQPIDLVSWDGAHAYCAWLGKRLPTEAEWEWAASGPEHTKYPWGDEPEPDCEHVDYTKGGAPKWKAGGDVGCDGGGPSAIGTHPKGDRVWPWGHIHDLAGNVFEWVEDSYAPYPHDAQTDPLVRQETAIHAIRGGAWNRSEASMYTYYRASAYYLYQVPGLGFRCARGRPHPTPPPRQKKW